MPPQLSKTGRCLSRPQRSLFNSVGIYVSFPLLLALALILIFFHIPIELILYLATLPALALTATVIIKNFLIRRLSVSKSFHATFVRRRHAFIIHIFTLLVLVCGPIDVYINGFKLLDPLSYADLNGNGRYVRHISSLCWTLIPIAFIFHHKTKTKAFLIFYAVIFAIIIIDRNRLLAAFYALALCSALTPDSVSATPKVTAKWGKRHLLLLTITVIAVFAGLGALRSGAEAFMVESSGTILTEGMLPLRDIFYYLSPLLQQILLYIAMPMFNFATVFFEGFLNTEFLLSQLSPFGRDMFDAYPYAPVLVARFNVGTEFFPWLTYGGILLVIPIFVFMVMCFIFAERLFKKSPNIFTLLIFLRLSYLMLFMGFAPQFYILLNIGFIVLMLGMWAISSWLVSGKKSLPV